MKRWLELGLLLVLVAVATSMAVRACHRIERYRAADAVCGAVAAGDWEAALAAGADLAGPSVDGRRVAECRCVAQMETGDKAGCVAALEAILASPESDDWLPMPLLTAVLVEARRDAGRLQAAGQLANRGARRYPDDVVLFYLELVLRTQAEEEERVLAEIEARVDATPLEPKKEGYFRLQLADRYLQRHDWEAAARVLGDEPQSLNVVPVWFRFRTTALAGAGRGEALRQTLRQWEEHGGDPYFVRAYYAFLLSRYHVSDPGQSRLELLFRVVEEGDQLQDEAFLRAIWQRLVGALAVAGSHQEAIRYYDLGVERFGDLEPIDRDEIMRSATLELFGEEELSAAVGRLAFVARDAEAGDRLLVSPGPTAPVDTSYEVAPLVAGRAEVERAVGIAPQRWVLVDDGGRVRGSGTVWPVPEETVEVVVERRDASAPPAPHEVELARADGSPRLLLVVLDCADWRLVQYLRARREMPVLDALIDGGFRAVMTSDPPFTARAIQSLVTPQQRGVASLFGVVHGLGTEIEALNFVGRNPAGLLEWVLAVRDDIFTVLGAGELATVNMLHSYGPLDVGRHGEVIGPFGERGELTGQRASRPLTAEERRVVPIEDEVRRRLVEEMAGDFDTLGHVVADTAADLVVLRVASLDLLTHNLFADVVRTGQDDGVALLLAVYRYLDRRLGELHRLLDGDDVLLVISDHGIRSSMEHDTRAIFVASGAGVPRGRAEGSPELHGVGRAVADFFGVETDWPETGLSWVDAEL